MEKDPTDAPTLYGKTKNLGEITVEQHVTIRTSIVGPELKPHGIGLFHWFMQQVDMIQGYRRVFWNGVTTLELAKAIEWLLPQPVSGLIHLATPQKISKYTLLYLFREVFNRSGVTIHPRDDIRSDKTLLNTRADFTYPLPPYIAMLRELKEWMESHTERNYPYA